MRWNVSKADLDYNVPDDRRVLIPAYNKKRRAIT